MLVRDIKDVTDNQLVTIVCIGGWKYTGKIKRVWFSMLGVAGWFEIQTKNSVIKINERHVIAIIYANNA